MISNYYTFQYLVSILNSTIVGWRVRDAYTQQADEMVVAFDDDPRHLIFHCRPDTSAVYLHDGTARARRNSVDVLRECAGTRVDSVSMHPSDRVMYFALEGRRTLAALLFGPRANVLLLDDAGKVLDAFKIPRKLTGTTAEFSAEAPAWNFGAFRDACASAGTRTIASVIRKSFPPLGGTLTLESLARAEVDASRKAAETDAGAAAAIEKAIGSILTDIGSPVPRVYSSAEGTPKYFSLIPLRAAAGLQEERFPDVHRALRLFIAGRSAGTEKNREKDEVVAPLRQQLEKARRSLRAIQTDALDAGRAGLYESFGAALLAVLPELKKGAKTFDTEIGGERVPIPLEPALSPLQNAQRYFDKAKRAKAAGEESSHRLDELTRRIDRGEKLLALAEQSLPGDRAAKFLQENSEALEEFGLGARSKEREGLPFRVFTVEGGFEVWAGKNGNNNDLLTLRYARPDDLWFHARGGSGSHVVLRTRSAKGDPGKLACEQAAAIAAYYSKMKTAGTVAVAMTEKRFVRKPRGAPPGTVVIEREKVIFVQPGLPRGAED